MVDINKSDISSSVSLMLSNEEASLSSLADCSSKPRLSVEAALQKAGGFGTLTLIDSFREVPVAGNTDFNLRLCFEQPYILRTGVSGAVSRI